jgi:hypothetical protein
MTDLDIRYFGTVRVMSGSCVEEEGNPSDVLSLVVAMMVSSILGFRILCIYIRGPRIRQLDFR